MTTRPASPPARPHPGQAAPGTSPAQSTGEAPRQPSAPLACTRAWHRQARPPSGHPRPVPGAPGPARPVPYGNQALTPDAGSRCQHPARTARPGSRTPRHGLAAGARQPGADQAAPPWRGLPGTTFPDVGAHIRKRQPRNRGRQSTGSRPRRTTRTRARKHHRRLCPLRLRRSFPTGLPAAAGQWSPWPAIRLATRAMPLAGSCGQDVRGSATRASVSRPLLRHVPGWHHEAVADHPAVASCFLLPPEPFVGRRAPVLDRPPRIPTTVDRRCRRLPFRRTPGGQARGPGAGCSCPELLARKDWVIKRTRLPWWHEFAATVFHRRRAHGGG
ncbi:hypothetical protein JOF53_006865 [Crossiella equi]|uniref:Uncharacterized protein n=1 Tax=Crossiella equi TaxID=130796 RepID=A0ABS5AN46_9PSEU|nr:hypothetical protein [Crossiella equi]